MIQEYVAEVTCTRKQRGKYTVFIDKRQINTSTILWGILNEWKKNCKDIVIFDEWQIDKSGCNSMGYGYGLRESWFLGVGVKEKSQFYTKMDFYKLSVRYTTAS